MQNPPVLPSLTAKDSLPASELRIELETRITTQPLHYRSGDEEAALQSVHALFASTRKLLVAHPQAGGFGVAATFVLNSVLRPYTARWHRWLVEERFADERARRQFRYELTLLQTQLRRFVELLRLMGDPANQLQATTRFHEIAVDTPEAVRAAKLGTALAAGIGPEVKPRMENFAGQSEPFVTADTINQAEWKFIRHRREALAGQTPGEMDQEAPIKNATGLCLSGGGIRSATFCLGIVQVLARQKLLPQFDYLSTVSGGGYLGTFLTSYLGTPSGGLRDKEQPFNQAEMHAALDRTFKPEGSRESAAVRHLRNNSRFLLNGGPWGRVRAGGLLITGILTNILIMLPLPLVAALLVVGLKRMGFWEVIENPPPLGVPRYEVRKVPR